MKRYDPVKRFEQGGRGYGEVEECPDGDFVAFDEAKKIISDLEHKCARLHEDAKKSEERKKWWMKNAEDIAIERGELFRAGEALAVEAFHAGLISKVEAWDEAAQPMRDMMALLKSALPNVALPNVV